MPVEHPSLIYTGTSPGDKCLFHNRQPINTKQKFLPEENFSSAMRYIIFKKMNFSFTGYNQLRMK